MKRQLSAHYFVGHSTEDFGGKPGASDISIKTYSRREERTAHQCSVLMIIDLVHQEIGQTLYGSSDFFFCHRLSTF